MGSSFAVAQLIRSVTVVQGALRTVSGTGHETKHRKPGEFGQDPSVSILAEGKVEVEVCLCRNRCRQQGEAWVVLRRLLSDIQKIRRVAAQRSTASKSKWIFDLGSAVLCRSDLILMVYISS